MLCDSFIHWCFPAGQIKKSCCPRAPVASQSGVTGWATGRGRAQVTTASALFGLQSISIRHPKKITEQRLESRFGQWLEALSPLISAQTIWADGRVGGHWEKREAAQHWMRSGPGPCGSVRESNEGWVKLSQQLTGTGTNGWSRSGKRDTQQ